jgi:dipeptidase D
MNSKITDLAPGAIWKHFYALTQIPRPSGHEEAVIAYLSDYVKKLGLESKIDKAGNLIVKKKAFSGMENAEKIILQSHVDMVPQKNSDKKHDFLKDPIEAIIDGEWVRANRTTLGADNGIGVASIMAVLESGTIKHGPLEALFTISEETGMDGAFGLEKGLLSGKVLLNLDSEEEGELYIGCAGGVNVNVNAKYPTEELHKRLSLKLKVGGLKGGHSGIDINLGRANANLLLVDLIRAFSGKLDVRLHSFSGGNLRNAIPREAEAIVTLDKSQFSAFKEIFSKIQTPVRKKFGAVETDMQVEFSGAGPVSRVMAADVQEKILQLISSSYNGVLQMSEQMPGVVQTSNNIAVVRMEKGALSVNMLLRSSADQEKDKFAMKIKDHFSGIHAETEFSGAYPGWLPDSNSGILSMAKTTYRKLFRKDAVVKVIHAGLECGIIAGAYPGLDMLSFGPTIKHPHSPDEKVHIGSVNDFWKFLVALLESA